MFVHTPWWWSDIGACSSAGIVAWLQAYTISCMYRVAGWAESAFVPDCLQNVVLFIRYLVTQITLVQVLVLLGRHHSGCHQLCLHTALSWGLLR